MYDTHSVFHPPQTRYQLAALRIAHDTRRRQRLDHLAHLAAQKLRCEPQASNSLRIRYTHGRRDLPEGWEDLREEDLYLTDALPPILGMVYLPIGDTCILCLMLKSHPVK